MVSVSVSQLQLWEAVCDPSRVTRSFDVDSPAVERDVIVGVNIYDPDSNIVAVYEFDSTGFLTPLEPYFVFYDTTLMFEGRGVVRSFDQRGYVVACAAVPQGSMDTMLVIVRGDTLDHQNGGTVLWSKLVQILDTSGVGYQRVVPVEVVGYSSQPPYLYLIAGYALHPGGQRHGWVMQIDDNGNILWTMVYIDQPQQGVHRESPLWVRDIVCRQNREAVVCGSRVTDYVNPQPPAGCINERQQGWIMVIDGMNGVVMQNGYIDGEDRCSELSQVEVAEDGQRVAVMAVGWGTMDGPVKGSLTYVADLTNITGGQAMWHMDPALGLINIGQYLTRLWDVEPRIWQGQIDTLVGLVGQLKDSLNGGLVNWGMYRTGYYDRQNLILFSTEGWNYNEDNPTVPEDEQVRYMEQTRSGEALILAGERGNRVVVRKVEWRRNHRHEFGRPECNGLLHPSLPTDTRKVNPEPIQFLPVLWQEVPVNVQRTNDVPSFYYVCY